MISVLKKKVNEIEKFVREKYDVKDFRVSRDYEISNDNFFFFAYQRIVDDIKKTVRKRHGA